MVIVKLGKEKLLLCRGVEKLKEKLGTPERVFGTKTCVGKFCNVDRIGPVYFYGKKNGESLMWIKNGSIEASRKISLEDLIKKLTKKGFI